MRTNIVINDKLMKTAMTLTGAKTKKQVVELALQYLVKIKEQEKIKNFRGKLHWEGNLDEMREGR